MIKKVICSVKRGQLEESRHEISCIVVNQNNKILFQSGNTNKSHCLRSTLKPFQCAASLEHGTDKKYQLSQKEIAITCASHHGEEEHVNTVRSILKKINLTENSLECGFHLPLNKENKAKTGRFFPSWGSMSTLRKANTVGLLILVIVMFYWLYNYSILAP